MSEAETRNGVVIHPGTCKLGYDPKEKAITVKQEISVNITHLGDALEENLSLEILRNGLLDGLIMLKTLVMSWLRDFLKRGQNVKLNQISYNE